MIGNKSKIRIFWGWKPSKIKNIDFHQKLIILIKKCNVEFVV